MKAGFEIHCMVHSEWKYSQVNEFLLKKQGELFSNVSYCRCLGRKNQQDIHPSNELQKILLRQSSSTSVIHGPTA